MNDWTTDEQREPITIQNINTMYNQGYFKALIDIKNEIEILTKEITELKSKKKYANCIQSMLKILTENSELEDNFRTYGGFRYCGDTVSINTSTGEMIYKRKDKNVKS